MESHKDSDAENEELRERIKQLESMLKEFIDFDFWNECSEFKNNDFMDLTNKASELIGVTLVDVKALNTTFKVAGKKIES